MSNNKQNARFAFNGLGCGFSLVYDSAEFLLGL
jgi:hypothetical protein